MKKKIERKCWWCRSDNFFIEDVDPDDEIKAYSDIQQSSNLIQSLRQSRLTNLNKDGTQNINELLHGTRTIQEFMNTIKSLNFENIRRNSQQFNQDQNNNNNNHIFEENQSQHLVVREDFSDENEEEKKETGTPLRYQQKNNKNVNQFRSDNKDYQRGNNNNSKVEEERKFDQTVKQQDLKNMLQQDNQSNNDNDNNDNEQNQNKSKDPGGLQQFSHSLIVKRNGEFVPQQQQPLQQMSQTQQIQNQNQRYN